MENLKPIIESLLFAAGEPTSIKKIARTINKRNEEIENAVLSLQIEYKNRGLKIIKHDNKVEMVTSPENKKYVEEMIKSSLKEDLSQPGLETLAVIAYKGPVTRGEIESIRGVNCVFTLRNLLMRGLIQKSDKPEDNRSYVYKVSFDFLKKLGINSVEELPEYDRLQRLANGN